MYCVVNLYGVCTYFVSILYFNYLLLFSLKVKTNDPENLLYFKSAAAQLPSELLKQYRIVSLVTPDVGLMVEINLVARGFLNARELARKVTILFDTCKQVLGTMAPITNSTSHLSTSPNSLS